MGKYQNLLYINEFVFVDDIVNKAEDMIQSNLEVYNKELAFINSGETDAFMIALEYQNKCRKSGKSFSEEEYQLELKKYFEDNKERKIEELNREFESYRNVDLLFDIASLGKSKNTLEYICHILKKMKELNLGVNKVSFQMLGKDIDFREAMPTVMTKEELDELKIVEKYLAENELVEKLFLQEGKGGNALSIKEVENANVFVDNVVNKIKKMDLSPFEVAVYVHDFCSNFYFNRFDEDSSRVLADVVSSGKIVCVGYASMYKAIIDRLDISDLSVKLNVCFAFNTYGLGHANNLVNIKDEKYDINGTYIEDSCWGAIGNDNIKNSTLTYCLYPIDDIEFIVSNYFYSNVYNMQTYYGIDEKNGVFEDRTKEQLNKDNKENHKDFLDSIEYKGKAISIDKYCRAYYNVLMKCGYKKEQAKKITQEKMDVSVYLAKLKFKDGCLNSFHNRDVSEKFMAEQETEVRRINKELSQLYELYMATNNREERIKILDKKEALENRKRTIIDKKHSDGIKNNKEIISSVLNEKR